MAEPLHVSSMWESAYVYAFCFHFGDLVSGRDEFGPEDFERDLYLSTPTTLLDCLFYTFLTNALNRKKQIDRASFRRSFSDLIDAKVKLGDFELDENPLKHADNYHQFKPDIKLLLLKALVDWQLQDSTLVRQAIERYYAGSSKNRNENPLHVIPFGTDGKKRVYWHFGDNARLYREKAPSYAQNPRVSTVSTWEAITTSLEELKGFAATELLSPVDTEDLSPTLSPSRSSTPPVSGKSKSKITNFFPTKPTTPKPTAIPKCEKMLHIRITEELIPHIEQRILRRERIEKSRQRVLSSLANTRITETRTRLRTNRQPVKYNFDDEPDDEFDQYYEEVGNRAAKQESRSTSRSSLRNPSGSIIPRTEPIRRSTRGQRGSQSREGSMDISRNLSEDTKMNDITMENGEQVDEEYRKDIDIELDNSAPFISSSSRSTLFIPNGESKRLAGSKRGSYSSLEPDGSISSEYHGSAGSRTEQGFEESEISEFSEGGEPGSAPKKRKRTIKSDYVLDGIGLMNQNDFQRKVEKEIFAELEDKTMLEG